MTYFYWRSAMNITVEDFINDFSYKLINNQVSFLLGRGCLQN